MLDPSEDCGGIRYAGPPLVSDGAGSWDEGFSACCARHGASSSGFAAASSLQCACGSKSMTPAPTGGRGRDELKVNEALQPCDGGTRKREPPARLPATGIDA